VTEFDARRYWDGRFDREWNLHSVGMLNLAHSYNRWLYRVRRDNFRRTVRELGLDMTSSDVLGIGSGTGFYLDLWRRAGAGRVTGIDIADSAVSRLHGKFPSARVERGDISGERPFEKETFDIVSAFDILFHVVDDDGYRRAFANVHDMLRPGGTFVFTEDFLHGRRKGNGRHYVYRTLAEIETIVAEAGFEVVSRRPVFALMTGPVDAPHPWRTKFWRQCVVPLAEGERSGNLVGAALFPLELGLTRVLPESDSIEVMVCRKNATPAAPVAGPPVPSFSARIQQAVAETRRSRSARRGDARPRTLVRRAVGVLNRAQGAVRFARADGVGWVTTRPPARLQPLARGAALVRAPRVARKNTFQIHRALHKQMTTEHVADLLRAYRVNCVLDVGANKGQYARSLRKAGYHGHIVSFEPVQAIAEELAAVAASDENWSVQYCALGREDTTRVMNAVPGSLSSLLPPSEYGTGRYKQFQGIAPVDVPVRRLDGMLDEILPAGLGEPRCYLKMDTQGYDVEVFAGLGERVADFVGMQSEVAVLRIYEGMPRLTEAIETFEAAGFEITGMFPVTREKDTGRVLEFDCVLARAEALKAGQ
jgi:FkbM family methyltransferase